MSTPAETAPAANALWGGRFGGGAAEIMEQINASIGFDKRLAAQDIAGSIAHARMLAAVGILTAEDAAAIEDGLNRIAGEIAEGSFVFSTALEDIHMNVETRLRALIGDAAGRLHTARSRNDQVATDFRLWVRDAVDQAEVSLRALQAALLALAEDHVETVMPGFTHLQVAQPVSLAHHLLAYVEMLERDRGRLSDCRRRLNESPLGAAALAGTPHPIDRAMTAAALGFDRPMANSMDAVSARDFALEYLAAATICGTHLSRLADEIVLWCSQSFGFVALSDAYTSGSSIMPQKRNPDAAELVRAKVGRLLGGFTGLVTVLKGLPLTYSKDMQEDKEPVFLAHDTLMLCLAAMAGMIGDMQPRPLAMRRAAERGFPTATDLADWLVRVGGVPFREAHHITGRLVKAAEEAGIGLAELPLEVMQTVHPGIDAGVYAVLTLDASLAARRSEGGTAPDRVREALAAARARLDGGDKA